MGVIHNGGGTVLAVEELEAAGGALQHTHLHQHLILIGAQQHRRAIDGQQVVGVETAAELEEDLTAVDAHLQAPERVVEHLPLEGGGGQQTVSGDAGLAVLHHHHSILVVHIGEGKRRLGQFVEEGLLGIDIVFERLVEVKVVVGDVAEDGAREVESRDAVLADGVGTHLHKAVFTAGIDHPCQQAVELHGIGGGVRGGHLLLANPVDDGGEQARLVAHQGEEAMQQRHGGGLAVGAGDAHEFQLAAGLAIESAGQAAECQSAVGHFHVSDLGGYLPGQILAHNHAPTGFHHLRYEAVTVGLGAALRHIERGAAFGHTSGDAARVEDNLRDITLRTAHQLVAFQALQQIG